MESTTSCLGEANTALTSDDISITEPSDARNKYTVPVLDALVIAIGIIGLIANAVVLYVLVASQQTKKRLVNFLVVNQVSLDLFSCAWLAITYVIKLFDISYDGTSGFLLCVVIANETLSYVGILGSTNNLAAIALERYIKIVHPLWHKKRFKMWMIYVAIAATWIASTIYSMAVSVTTTEAHDFQCVIFAKWDSEASSIIFAVYLFLGSYLIFILIFIFCYGNILLKIRQQARVFAVQYVNNPLGRANHQQDIRIQMNAIKVMISVSGLFIVCWSPFYFYNLLAVFLPDMNFDSNGYYTILVVAFLNITLNPFLYAANYDIVKQYLLKIVWSRCSDHHLTTNTIQSVSTIM